MKFTVRPPTPDPLPALENLFGKNGACNGCWCMYWRLGPAYFERPRENNRSALRKIVSELSVDQNDSEPSASRFYASQDVNLLTEGLPITALQVVTDRRDPQSACPCGAAV